MDGVRVVGEGVLWFNLTPLLPKIIKFVCWLVAILLGAVVVCIARAEVSNFLVRLVYQNANP